MIVKKFTSFCQALKRCTQKKIGSIGLYDNLFLLSHVGRRIHLDMIRLKFSTASHT